MSTAHAANGASSARTRVPSGSEPRSNRRCSEIVELDRPECLRLLSGTGFGRLAINGQGGTPIVRPVNYRFDERSQSVVFRTARGSKFHALVLSAKAAFEIDGTDPSARVGWSVIIVGVIEQITDLAEMRRLERHGLEPWAAGDKPPWVLSRA